MRGCEVRMAGREERHVVWSVEDFVPLDSLLRIAVKSKSLKDFKQSDNYFSFASSSKK